MNVKKKNELTYEKLSDEDVVYKHVYISIHDFRNFIDL